MPVEASTVSPLIQWASSLRSQAMTLLMSSGIPVRPIAARLSTMPSACSLSLTAPPPKSVYVAPAAMAFMEMPRGLSSRAW